MTIKEVIIDLKLRNVNARMAKLKEIGAPPIMITALEGVADDLKAGIDRVNGMTRKFKVADEQVTALYEADGLTYDYAKGKNQKTVILKMETSAGEFFYDYYDNKISNRCEAQKTSDFELVWN